MNAQALLNWVSRPFAVARLNFGFDPRRIFVLQYLPKYILQYRRFKKLGGKINKRFPVLCDYIDQAGSARGHYFHQDLLVASLVHEANPRRHVDIGSRVDGFVAHVASFRKIEVIDVRELDDAGHSNISFLRADLMDETKVRTEITDSISCLHAIEHFGLGRYGDCIDPDGHFKGFRNILRMLKGGGMLYISFPVGRSNEVHFNSQRVFLPKDILSWSTGDADIELMRFDFVDDGGVLHQNIDLNTAQLDLKYGCGIYTFRKSP